MSFSEDVLHERHGHLGLITLNRPRALNALSLPMVRELARVLTEWRDDSNIWAVAIRGSNKEGAFGAFCAGGDIRYFHQAALAGDPTLEDFFTEEYSLNALIQTYPKPYVAFMDGVVMGGGMGISQGAALRIVTERTQMAMPETLIGLFPDVGGSYFLSRCPGYLGEYLALTGYVLHGSEALFAGLADVCMASVDLPNIWLALQQKKWSSSNEIVDWLRAETQTSTQHAISTSPTWNQSVIDQIFGLPSVLEIDNALAGSDEWAVRTRNALHLQSPLMLNVTLEQIRRGRKMTLAQSLQMERNMVRHCFHPVHLSRQASTSETVEGIRALVIDKDRKPLWNPSQISEVTDSMVLPFFDSPWPANAHPLRYLTQ